ncbi:MAG: hypothetical protein P9L88_06625 [Candidatus Tantalella remota]|nr:hypothetical protein [Candidatus Tantalella remota]
MKTTIVLGIVLVLLAASSAYPQNEKITYDFEESTGKWKIPDWAYMLDDHVARGIELAPKQSSTGESSMAVMCDFPGVIWSTALVEVEKDYDLTGYESISVDIYLPRKAPRDLMFARIILTISDGWLFTQMKDKIPLTPGKWTTVTVPLESVEPEGRSSAWRGRKDKRLFLHIDKIKKIAVRIEYDTAPPTRTGPRYKGPIYIDNLVIE